MNEKDTPQSEQFAGSPNLGEPAFLVIGKLRRPHGLNGEVVMEVITDFPERLHPGMLVYVGPDYRKLFIQRIRGHHEQLLVAFKEYSTPEQVGVHRNHFVYVRLDDRPALEPGEYYHHQILNMQVLDESDKLLGTVADILETGANDVLVVRRASGPDVLIPYIESLLLDINLEEGIIRVRMLPGLMDSG